MRLLFETHTITPLCRRGVTAVGVFVYYHVVIDTQPTALHIGSPSNALQLPHVRPISITASAPPCPRPQNTLRSMRPQPRRTVCYSAISVPLYAVNAHPGHVFVRISCPWRRSRDTPPPPRGRVHPLVGVGTFSDAQLRECCVVRARRVSSSALFRVSAAALRSP